MSQRVAQGGTVTLEATFRTGTGALLDPVDVDVDVFTADQTAAPAVLTRTGLGQWQVVVTVGAYDPVGVWRAEWSASINGVLVRATEQFEVVPLGQIGAGGYPLLVNPPELLSYMSDVGLSTSQAQSAQTILEGVQDALADYLNRPVVRTQVTEVLTPDEVGRVWPSVTPVVSVSTPGATLHPGHYLTGVYGPPALPGSSAVQVTYVGGIDGHNAPRIRLGILRVAAREMTNRHDDTLSVKDLSARNEGDPTAQQLGWTKDELERFDRDRRRTVVSGL